MQPLPAPVCPSTPCSTASLRCHARSGLARGPRCASGGLSVAFRWHPQGSGQGPSGRTGPFAVASYSKAVLSRGSGQCSINPVPSAVQCAVRCDVLRLLWSAQCQTDASCWLASGATGSDLRLSTVGLAAQSPMLVCPHMAAELTASGRCLSCGRCGCGCAARAGPARRRRPLRTTAVFVLLCVRCILDKRKPKDVSLMG